MNTEPKMTITPPGQLTACEADMLAAFRMLNEDVQALAVQYFQTLLHVDPRTRSMHKPHVINNPGALKAGPAKPRVVLRTVA